MSHSQPITIPPETWTLVSDCSAFYQVTSPQAIFTTEQDDVPTEAPDFEGGDPAVRKVASGLYSRFERHLGESIWGWSPIGYSFVTVTKSPNSQPGVVGEAVNKFGVNTDLDIATVPMDVWSHNGLYPFSTFATAQSLEVESDSDEDDVGLTGAEAVIVIGLDDAGLDHRETVAMNGQTPVALAGTWLAVNRMEIVDGATGAIGANVGQIHCQVSGGGAVVSEIVALRGQTQQAVYRVAANKSISVVKTQAWFRGNQTGDAVVNPATIGADCNTIRLRGELSLVVGAPAEREYAVGGLEVNALEWFTLRVTSVSRNDTVIIGEWDAVIFGDGV